MSNYEGYRLEDNVKRKSNNTGDVVETAGKNQNVKSWSSKPGQLSARQQANLEAKKYQELNKQQEVKRYTKEEYLRMTNSLPETSTPPVQIETPTLYSLSVMQLIQILKAA